MIKTTQLLIWKYFIFKKPLYKKFLSKKFLFKNQVINCLITKSSPNNSKKTFKNAKKTTEIKGFAKVFLLKKPLFLVLINAVNFLISLRWIFTAKIFFTAMNSLLVSQCNLEWSWLTFFVIVIWNSRSFPITCFVNMSTYILIKNSKKGAESLKILHNKMVKNRGQTFQNSPQQNGKKRG